MCKPVMVVSWGGGQIVCKPVFGVSQWVTCHEYDPGGRL